MSNSLLKDLYLFDDFLLREFDNHKLETRKYFKEVRANYPGEITHVSKKVEELAFKFIKQKLNLAKTDFKDYSFRIRRSKKGQKARTHIHYDDADLVMLSYLNSPPSGIDPFSNGTFFYQHLKSKLNQYTDTCIKKMLISKFIVKNDGKNQALWKVLKNIPFKKGTTLLYPGKYFHSGPLTSLKGIEFERFTFEVFLKYK